MSKSKAACSKGRKANSCLTVMLLEEELVFASRPLAFIFESKLRLIFLVRGLAKEDSELCAVDL